MASPSLSTHNPFRTPAASPTPTGASTLGPPVPARPAATPEARVESDVLNEELPPAYTAGPDTRHGEHTLEIGPARPFQQAPRQPRQMEQGHGYGYPGSMSRAGAAPAPRQQTPSEASWNRSPVGLLSQLTDHIVTNLERSISSAVSPGRNNNEFRYAPPSGAPPDGGPRSAPPAPAPQLSEFARDFYATTQVPPGGFSDVSGARNLSAEPRSAYPLPPGQPPSGGAGIPDDGRPTTTPVPGHPLLHGGKMLVYPAGVECSKCNNTGYRHTDPSHPCRKCWDKYAKPYAGAMLAAPSSNSSSGGNTHGSTFQRPLPRLYAAGSSRPPASAPPWTTTTLYPPPPSAPPRPSSATSHSAYPPPPQHPHMRSRSASHLPPPGPPSPVPPGAYPGAGYRSGYGAPQGPGQAFSPGDPRLGGTPCWRCDGRGSVSFLLFDSAPCRVCGGVGRVYR
ncbi:hypothetical protein HMN09_00149900 [Mycena chlorophos]|uniref:Uncharacterized protein n=1 Tax=Mycena chlorophos TaxID=658473 RepID=A0A8H6TPY2_MYCCL|nr:hypothetical protein HMN09_00149900 [Mycena chlorophos]